MTFEPAAAEPESTLLGASGAERLQAVHADIAVVVNARAGGVRRMGRTRIERAVRRTLKERLAELTWVEPPGVVEALRAAAARRPRVLAVLGGDGTAQAALDAAKGRVPVAPLPGGTLNRLSRAVYGRRGLQACLSSLADGEARWLPAGRIGPHRFYVVCGFGPLMELDALREDLRAGRGVGAAWARLAAVGRRGFQEAVLWSPPDQEPRAASALVVALGPVDSAFGMAPPAPRLLLEGAGAKLDGWADVAGLAARVAVRRWRSRCGLATRRSASIEVTGLNGPVFGLLDGERRLLPERFTIEMEPAAALVWGPRQDGSARLTQSLQGHRHAPSSLP